MLKKTYSYIAVILCGFCVQGTAYLPTLSKERVVLRTKTGDIAIAFYPQVAPVHTSTLLGYFKKGIYESTHFVRIEPNFVAQLSSAEDRLLPLTDFQTKLISKTLPLEVDLRVLHKMGRLSMAREDGKLNSAKTSFSILLGDAPHLDGKYTVFGEVVKGYPAVDNMTFIPRNNTRPVTRLDIQNVFVFPTEKELENFDFQSAKIPKTVLEPLENISNREEQTTRSDLPITVLIGGMFLIAVLSLVVVLRMEPLPLRSIYSINMLISFMSLICIYVSLLQLSELPTWVGGVLFFGLVGTFKLMSRFESY